MPTTITGENGTQSGSFASAAAMATVEFQWTCPNPLNQPNLFFSTAQPAAAATNYPTLIRIYNADSSWNQQGEVAYQLNQQNGIGNGASTDTTPVIGGGFQCGAYVQFAPTAGNNYIIKIFQRPSLQPIPASPAWYFAWGDVSNVCSSCDQVPILAGACLAGSFTYPSGLAGNWYQYFSFGSWAQKPGKYIAVICDSLDDLFSYGGEGFTNIRFGGDPEWPNPNPPDGSGFIDYSTYWNETFDPSSGIDVEPCPGKVFDAPGGEIGVISPNVYWPPSALAYQIPYGAGYYGTGNFPPPWVSARLFYVDCALSYFKQIGFAEAEADGSNWDTSLNFANQYPFQTWDSVTVAFAINGGATLKSQTSDFPYNSNVQLNFDNYAADPTSGLLTADLTFTRNSATIGVIQMPLYPVFTLSFGPTSGNSNYGPPTGFTSTDQLFFGGVCPGLIGAPFNPVINLLNCAEDTDFFGGNLVLDIKISGSAQMYYNFDCTPITELLYEPDSPSGIGNPWIAKPSVDNGTTLTITPLWQISGSTVYTFPTQTYTVKFL